MATPHLECTGHVELESTLEKDRRFTFVFNMIHHYFLLVECAKNDVDWHYYKVAPIVFKTKILWMFTPLSGKEVAPYVILVSVASTCGMLSTCGIRVPATASLNSRRVWLNQMAPRGTFTKCGGFYKQKQLTRISLNHAAS